MFVFEEMKLHTNLGVGGDKWACGENNKQIFHYQTVHMLDEHVQGKKCQNRSPCFLIFLLAACR